MSELQRRRTGTSMDRSAIFWGCQKTSGHHTGLCGLKGSPEAIDDARRLRLSAMNTPKLLKDRF